PGDGRPHIPASERQFDLPVVPRRSAPPRAQLPQLLEERVDVLEVAVDGRESHIRHVVPTLQALHHHLPDRAALDLVLPEPAQLILDLVDHRLDLGLRDRTLHARQAQRSQQLAAVVRLRRAIPFEDDERPLLHVLVGREAAAAAQAFPTTAHRAPLTAGPRVDDAVFRLVAVWTTHRRSSYLPPGSGPARTSRPGARAGGGTGRDSASPQAPQGIRSHPRLVAPRIAALDTVEIFAGLRNVPPLLRDEARTVERLGRARRVREQLDDALQLPQGAVVVLVDQVRLADLELRVRRQFVRRVAVDDPLERHPRRRRRAFRELLHPERVELLRVASAFRRHGGPEPRRR